MIELEQLAPEANCNVLWCILGAARMIRVYSKVESCFNPPGRRLAFIGEVFLFFWSSHALPYEFRR